MEFVINGVTSFILQVIESAGYPGILFLMALEGSFIPLPSEIILPFSGFLASEGRFSLWMIALVGAVGNIVGTLFSYTIARYLGLPFLYKYGKYVLVTREDIDRAHALFIRFGTLFIFISRLLPGIRGFIPIPAGIAKMNLIPFVTYVFLGSLFYSFALAYVGFLLGEHWNVVGPYLQRISGALLIVAAGAIAWWVWYRIRVIKRESKQYG